MSIFLPKLIPGIIIKSIFPLDLKTILQGKFNAFPWTEAAKRCVLSAGFGAPAPRQGTRTITGADLKTANTQISTEHKGQMLSLLKFLFPLN